jgi:hypothetical protein
MTAALFINFLAVMVAALVTLIASYVKSRSAVSVLASLCVWFIYAGLLAYWGVLRNTSTHPPGVVFLFGPVLLFLIVFVLFIGRSTAGARLAMATPLWIILGAQCFRIGVELFLHQLWIDGLIPKMLTFQGANVDIYIGASAPLIAWLSTRGRLGIKIALAWNVLGLLSLINVVIRAVLTVPGPFDLIHAEIPNQMIGTFPFLFIPGFFVPLAVALHVVAIRLIITRLRIQVPGAVLNDRGENPKLPATSAVRASGTLMESKITIPCVQCGTQNGVFLFCWRNELS